MVGKRSTFSVIKLHFWRKIIRFTQLVGSLCDVIGTRLRCKSMLIEPQEQCFCA